MSSEGYTYVLWVNHDIRILAPDSLSCSVRNLGLEAYLLQSSSHSSPIIVIRTIIATYLTSPVSQTTSAFISNWESPQSAQPASTGARGSSPRAPAGPVPMSTSSPTRLCASPGEVCRATSGPTTPWSARERRKVERNYLLGAST